MSDDAGRHPAPPIVSPMVPAPPAYHAAYTTHTRTHTPVPPPNTQHSPRRPDAAVIVAAESDAYVSTDSVRALHAYWAGSELRLVSGGHGALFWGEGGQRGQCNRQRVRVALVALLTVLLPTPLSLPAAARKSHATHTHPPPQHTLSTVSAFLLHQAAFRRALRDGLSRLGTEDFAAPPRGG